MTITRVLEREGKELVYEVSGGTLTTTPPGKPPVVEALGDDHAAARRMIERSRAKLGQGWTPRSKPARVGELTQALEKAHLRIWDWVVGLSEAELAQAYREEMARGGAGLSLDVLRRRPTRELFAFMLARFDRYYEPDWTKAVKLLAKDPGQAQWILEELGRALAQGSLPTDRARRFAERNSKKIAAGPKPEPVAPDKPVGDEASALRAIAEAPDEDAPRLVYADWLLERGLGWGETIQLALRLARLADDDPDRAELQAQLGKLEKKHARAWLEPIRPFIRSWSFERGLIGWLICDAGLFAQAAGPIALRAPRARIGLTGLKKKDVPALAHAPLGAFATVDLSQQRLDDAGIAELVGSPTIAGVVDWQLGHNGFGDSGLASIAGSPHLASVMGLSLEAFKPRFSADGLRELFASGALPALRHLRIAAEGAEGAFRACRLELETLALSVSRFGDADAEALARAQSLSGLTHLAIHQAGSAPLALSDEGIEALLGRLKKLRSVSTNARISEKMQARIAQLGR